ncbi:MAG: SAP domain-containing protein [Candidatus Brocadiia bacterium]
MEIARIKEKAKGLGINIPQNGVTKQELIRLIQALEGHDQCFRAPKNECAKTQCVWREDCVPE